MNIYTTTPGASAAQEDRNPQTVIHELSIYKESDQYYAIFTVEGWLTYYKIKAQVIGDSDHISILYDSHEDGVNAFTKEDPVKESVLFKLIKVDNELKTEWIWPSPDWPADAFQVAEK